MGFVVEHGPIAHKVFWLSKSLSSVLGNQIKHGSKFISYRLALFVNEIMRLFVLLFDASLSIGLSYH